MCYDSLALKSTHDFSPIHPQGAAAALRLSVSTCTRRSLPPAAEFGPLTKDASNTYLKCNYLSLPALLKAVREPLSDQGVVITSSFVQVGAQFVIRTMSASLRQRH